MLPGRTPGIRYPNFDYMIRRFRVQEDSPIDKVLRESSLPRERDLVSKMTMVYEYPILQGPAKPASQVSLWQQAMDLVWAQREWADNAVSNTLNFRPRWSRIAIIKDDFENKLSFYTDLQFQSVGLARDMLHEKRDFWEDGDYRIVFNYQSKELIVKDELESIDVFQFNPNHEEDDVEAVLSAIAPLTKSVSLLPHSSKGAYPQMPEEGIDKVEYLQRVADLQPIDWSLFGGSDGLDERYCNTDTCTIQ